jgi:hypothetical protein
MNPRFVDLVPGSNRETDQLQFLIQSGFLLIENREDIDSSSIWNHGLLEANSVRLFRCSSRVINCSVCFLSFSLVIKTYSGCFPFLCTDFRLQDVLMKWSRLIPNDLPNRRTVMT